MKYAIFSDIHANLTALVTALDDARRDGVEKTICLGDIVGYGPCAEETVEFVRREIDVTIMGNHDAAVAAVITGENFTLHALRGVRRHRAETTPASRRWLADLKYLHEEAGFACAHGEFSNPREFLYSTELANVMASWMCRKEHLLFAGHTHVSAVHEMRPNGNFSRMDDTSHVVLDPECRYFVNVGSVGYPRYEGKITYALYDNATLALEIRRLPFDFKKYEKQMRQRDAELPGWFDKMKRNNTGWFRWWK